MAGVYWQGSDGNYYVKADGVTGVQEFSPGPGGGLPSFAPLAPDIINSLSQIADPNAPSGSSDLSANTTTGGAGGVTQGVNDPNTLAQYDQAIAQSQAGIDRSGAQLNSAYSGIDASFQNALSQLLLGKNQANTAYTGAKQTAATDYVGAKNTIGANAGNTLNGILRLLGSRGAGGGSTARISAPGAVARGASLQRTDASNTFGANNQALDTNWNNFLTGYNNEVSSAGNQRDQQRQGASQANETNKANLLQTIAQLAAEKAAAQGGSSTAAAAPYLSQANNILNSLANYTTSPINYQTSAYQAPSLSSYSTGGQTPTYNGQTQTNDFTSPYLAGLLGKKQPAVA